MDVFSVDAICRKGMTDKQTRIEEIALDGRAVPWRKDRIHESSFYEMLILHESSLYKVPILHESSFYRGQRRSCVSTTLHDIPAYVCIDFTTDFAMWYANGGGTELPICRYCSHLDPQKVKPCGNPCKAAASLTVILLKVEGTGYFVMSSPSRAWRCNVTNQSSASGLRRRSVSMKGVLLPPMEAGNVWQGRSRSIGRPRSLNNMPEYGELRRTGCLATVPFSMFPCLSSLPYHSSTYCW